MEEVGNRYSFIFGGWIAALLILLGNSFLGGGFTGNGLFPFSTFAFFLPWPQTQLHWYSLTIPVGGAEEDIVTSRVFSGTPYSHLAISRLVQKAGRQIERGESASSTFSELLRRIPQKPQKASIYLDTSDPIAEYMNGASQKAFIGTFDLRSL